MSLNFYNFRTKVINQDFKTYFIDINLGILPHLAVRTLFSTKVEDEMEPWRVNTTLAGTNSSNLECKGDIKYSQRSPFLKSQFYFNRAD